jgi:hypothetical protein
MFKLVCALYAETDRLQRDFQAALNRGQLAEATYLLEARERWLPSLSVCKRLMSQSAEAKVRYRPTL